MAEGSRTRGWTVHRIGDAFSAATGSPWAGRIRLVRPSRRFASEVGGGHSVTGWADRMRGGGRRGPASRDGSQPVVSVRMPCAAVPSHPPGPACACRRRSGRTGRPRRGGRRRPRSGWRRRRPAWAGRGRRRSRRSRRGADVCGDEVGAGGPEDLEARVGQTRGRQVALGQHVRAEAVEVRVRQAQRLGHGVLEGPGGDVRQELLGRADGGDEIGGSGNPAHSLFAHLFVCGAGQVARRALCPTPSPVIFRSGSGTVRSGRGLSSLPSSTSGVARPPRPWSSRPRCPRRRPHGG